MDFLPDQYIAEQSLQPATPELEDLVDPEIEHLVYASGGLSYLYKDSPGLQERTKKYGSWKNRYGKVEVRWVATTIKASEKPFEEWRTMRIDNMWPYEVWKRYSESL